MPFNFYQSKVCPYYNYKATLVSCVGTGTVFLFGGFDEYDNLDSNVYLLDTNTKTWLVDAKHKGLYREGHLAVYIGNGNVLVFGGVPTDEVPREISRPRSRDLSLADFKKDSIMLIYNIFSQSWTSPPDFALSNAPVGRSRHGCCLSPDKSKVYISGGVIDSNTVNDLYSYDFLSGRWDGPYDFVHRFDHFITICDEKLFSFGGLNKNMNHVKDRISYFDLKDQTMGEISLLLSTIHDNIDEFITAYNSCQRIHLDNNLAESVKLDVTLPLNFTKESGFFIAYYNLKQLKHVSLIELNDVRNIVMERAGEDISHYFWRDCVIDQGLILLFGSPIRTENDEENNDEGNEPEETMNEPENENDPDGNDPEENGNENGDTGNGGAMFDRGRESLSVILELSLRDIGIEYTEKKETTNSLTQDFKSLLESQQFTDFEIYCFSNSDLKHQHSENPEAFNSLINPIFTGETISDPRLEVVKVHRTVLLARWGHFRRLIDSGMNESKYSRMFIPEPSLWVKGLVYYLYTGIIDFVSPILPSFTLVDYSGLLILSNFYELIELRGQLLAKIYESIDIFIRNKLILLDSEFQIGAILNIWINVLISNEELLIEKLTQLIKLNWSAIIKSESFSKLPKLAIIKIIQSCSSSDTPKPDSTPKRLNSRFDLVIGSSELVSTLGSPDRDCDSPFLQSSRAAEIRRDSEDLLAKLPALQHLSDHLNELMK